MNKKVVICGVDTSTLPKINAEQSKKLLENIKNGDDDSREYFINCNLRLVLSIVQRYNNRNVNLDDLFQTGCVGLLKAVDNFDPSFGVRFSTYAVPMIAGEIRRYLREGNSLRVSRGIRDVACQAMRARQELEEAGFDASIEQIAESLKLPVFRVVYCLNAISDTVSLSEPVYSDEEDTLTLADQLFDKKDGENVWSDNITLDCAICDLPERERDIVYKRFYQGKTQNEVSDEIGLSQAQVSRLEKNAITHMREYFG